MIHFKYLCVIHGVSGDSNGPLLQPFAPGGNLSGGQPNLDVILGVYLLEIHSPNVGSHN